MKNISPYDYAIGLFPGHKRSKELVSPGYDQPESHGDQDEEENIADFLPEYLNDLDYLR